MIRVCKSYTYGYRIYIGRAGGMRLAGRNGSFFFVAQYLRRVLAFQPGELKWLLRNEADRRQPARLLPVPAAPEALAP